jgi:hypothetical protein
MISGKTVHRLIAIPILVAAAALSAAAAPVRDAITAAQVADAISEAGTKVSARQVTLLTDVVSTGSAPILKVQSMQPWGNHQIKVRMSCARQEECLPFFVAVRDNDQNLLQRVSEDSRGPSPARSRPDSKSFVVRSGTPVTLLIDGERIHIKLSVICLENGAPGQTIRASSMDHKQTYSAEVVDGTLLRGRL